MTIISSQNAIDSRQRPRRLASFLLDTSAVTGRPVIRRRTLASADNDARSPAASLAPVPEPYHRYVFDEERQVLVGAFEEMYRNEERDGYDSWHQEDLSQTWRALVLALIESRRPRTILDIGCGKGVFTSHLDADRIVGVDISETAIEKARMRNPRAEFRCLRAEEISSAATHFDLAVCLELLSYVESWRSFLDDVSRIADALVLSLYLPRSTPIGSVKSFDELRDGIGAAWEISIELLITERAVSGSQLLVLADSRSRT